MTEATAPTILAAVTSTAAITTSATGATVVAVVLVVLGLFFVVPGWRTLGAAATTAAPARGWTRAGPPATTPVHPDASTYPNEGGRHGHKGRDETGQKQLPRGASAVVLRRSPEEHHSLSHPTHLQRWVQTAECQAKNF